MSGYGLVIDPISRRIPLARTQIGEVRELVRYPIKSMAGIPMEAAVLGWYGLAGDRRFAFRRTDDRGGFPWLTASRLPALITYQPTDMDELSDEHHPTCVQTPRGNRFNLRSEELRREISDQFGRSVELMHLQHGIFDDAAISVITSTTISCLCREAGVVVDARRFRPNIVLDSGSPDSFAEDEWLGGVLVFGASEAAPAVHVTKRDLRCMMINLDPDTAVQDGRVMKAAVRLNENYAGVYATVVRTGMIQVGDPVMLERGAAGASHPHLGSVTS